MQFRYHPDILSHFPDIYGGVIVAHEISNGSAPAPLQTLFLDEQRLVIEHLLQTAHGEEPRLSELPALAAWRQAFRVFGVDPTRYRSASEALLRRLTKKGDIPSINTLVDICNLVSIRYALPVAAFDLSALQGAITVQFSNGTELFTPHDQPGGETPAPGEVIFVDEAGRVHARRWCWKQSAESSANQDTSQALITVEAQHSGGKQEIHAALQDLLDLLRLYVGGSFQTFTLPG